MASNNLLTGTSVEGKPQSWQTVLLCSCGVLAVVGVAAMTTTPPASTELLSSTLPVARPGFAPRPTEQRLPQPNFVAGGNNEWSQRMKTQLNSAPVREHPAGDYTFIYHDNGRVSLRRPPQSPLAVAARTISGWTSAVQAMFGATIALAAVFAVKLASTCTPPRQTSREIKPIGVKRHHDGIIFQYPQTTARLVKAQAAFAAPAAPVQKLQSPAFLEEIKEEAREPMVIESTVALPAPEPVVEAPKAPPVVWDGALQTSMEWERHALVQRQARIAAILNAWAAPPKPEEPVITFEQLRGQLEQEREYMTDRKAEIYVIRQEQERLAQQAALLAQEQEAVQQLTLKITAEREQLDRRQKEIGRLRHRQEVEAAVAVQQTIEDERQRRWQQVVEAKRQQMEAELAQRRMELEKEAQIIQAMKLRLEGERRELAFTDLRLARELAIWEQEEQLAAAFTAVDPKKHAAAEAEMMQQITAQLKHEKELLGHRQLAISELRVGQEQAEAEAKAAAQAAQAAAEQQVYAQLSQDRQEIAQRQAAIPVLRAAQDKAEAEVRASAETAQTDADQQVSAQLSEGPKPLRVDRHDDGILFIYNLPAAPSAVTETPAEVAYDNMDVIMPNLGPLAPVAEPKEAEDKVMAAVASMAGNIAPHLASILTPSMSKLPVPDQK